MVRALLLRQQRDEGFLQRRLAGLVQHFLQRAAGDDLAVVHGHQPIEALRFVHVGGGDHHAHLRATRADSVDQIPELAARQRVDAGGRLVEDQQVRIVDQRAAEAELLLHAAGELAGRSGLERIKRSRGQKLCDLGAAFGRRLPEQTAEEIDVLEYAQRRIEIAAEPLRHVGDARAQAFELGGALEIAVEHHDLAGSGSCAHRR